uniref:GT23 domain-containing protein n=1 Tax=Ciona savignyi TaxID=51511 RepID=H2ZQB8_CIOSA
MSKLKKENKKILEMALKERNLYYMVIAGATACMLLSIFISSQLPPPEELPCDCTDYEISEEFLQQIQKMRKPSEVSRSTLERVVLTRKVRNDIKEMWNALQFELDNLLNHGEVDDALIRLKDRHMALMIEIEDLLKFDESWQNSLSKSLSSYVQNEFKSLQNPPNCNTTSPQMFIKLIGCGLGCEVHNIMTKFLVALGQGRTLFCYTRLISYELNDGFETRFEPLSENCRKPKAKANWQPLKDDELSKNET